MGTHKPYLQQISANLTREEGEEEQDHESEFFCDGEKPRINEIHRW